MDEWIACICNFEWILKYLIHFCISNDFVGWASLTTHKQTNSTGVFLTIKQNLGDLRLYVSHSATLLLQIFFCVQLLYRSGVIVLSQCLRHEKTAINCKNIKNSHIDWRSIIEFAIECMCILAGPLCYNSCFWLLLYFLLMYSFFPVSTLPFSLLCLCVQACAVSFSDQWEFLVKWR